MGLLGALFGVKDSAEYMKILQEVSHRPGGRGTVEAKFTGFCAFVIANMDVISRAADSVKASKNIGGKLLLISLEREMRAGGADTGRSILTVIAEK
jgi:hypothetical protein